MIVSVCDGLFQSLDRIVEIAETLSAVWKFDHELTQDVALQVGEGIANQLRNTSVENRLAEIVRIIHPTFGEDDYLCLSVREEFLWMVAKHHGSYIPQNAVLCWSLIEIHLLHRLLQGLLQERFCKSAAHFDEIVTKENNRYVVQSDPWIGLLIERTMTCKLHQFVMHFAFGNDAAGAFSNIKGGLLLLSSDIGWDCIRTV